MSIRLPEVRLLHSLLMPRSYRSVEFQRKGVILVLSFLFVGVFTAGLLRWKEVDDGLHYSGWHQGDYPTYLCYARQAAPETGFLAYAHPHDLRDDPPTIYVSLGISFLAVLLRSGVPPEWSEHIVRVVGGLLMFVALGWSIKPLFPSIRSHAYALTLAGAGGGAFALVALGDISDVTALPELATASRRLQPESYWWFLSTYRNLQYPLETLYHAILFTMVGFLIRQRLFAAVGMLALAFLANPFAGLQAGAAFGVSVVFILGRVPLRRLVKASLGAAVVVSIFALYYGVLLPLDEVAAAVSAQHRSAFPQPLSFREAFLAYALVALPLPLLLVPRGRRKREWDQLAPFLALAASATVLAHHSRFLPAEWVLQPMHFTRGYIFTGLAVMGAYALTSRLKPAIPGALVGIPLLIAALTDSAVFWYDQTYVMRPHVASLRWNDNQQRVLEYVASLPPSTRVAAPDWQISRLICSIGSQRSAFGTNYTTPGYHARLTALDSLIRCGETGTPEEKINLIVLSRDHKSNHFRRCSHWKVDYENEEWVVFRRISNPS